MSVRNVGDENMHGENAFLNDDNILVPSLVSPRVSPKSTRITPNRTPTNDVTRSTRDSQHHSSSTGAALAARLLHVLDPSEFAMLAPAAARASPHTYNLRHSTRDGSSMSNRHIPQKSLTPRRDDDLTHHIVGNNDVNQLDDNVISSNEHIHSDNSYEQGSEVDYSDDNDDNVDHGFYPDTDALGSYQLAAVVDSVAQSVRDVLFQAQQAVHGPNGLNTEDTARAIAMLTSLSDSVHSVDEAITETEKQVTAVSNAFHAAAAKYRAQKARNSTLLQGVAVLEQLAAIRALYDLYHLAMMPHQNGSNKGWTVDVGTAYRAVKQLDARVDSLPHLPGVSVVDVVCKRREAVDEEIRPKVAQVINRCLTIKKPRAPWVIGWSKRKLAAVMNAATSNHDDGTGFNQPTDSFYELFFSNKAEGSNEYSLRTDGKETATDKDIAMHLFVAAEVIVQPIAKFVVPVDGAFTEAAGHIFTPAIDDKENEATQNDEPAFESIIQRGKVDVVDTENSIQGTISVDVSLRDVLEPLVEPSNKQLEHLSSAIDTYRTLAADSKLGAPLSLINNISGFLKPELTPVVGTEHDDIEQLLAKFALSLFENFLQPMISKPLLEFDYDHGARLIDPALVEINAARHKILSELESNDTNREDNADMENSKRTLAQEENRILSKYSIANKIITWANRTAVVKCIQEDLPITKTARHSLQFDSELIKRLESVLTFLHNRIPEYYPLLVNVLLANHGEQLSQLIISKCLRPTIPRSIGGLRDFEAKLSLQCVLLENSILSHINEVCGDDGFKYGVIRYSVREWENFKETVLSFTTPLIGFCSDIDNHFLSLAKSKCLLHARRFALTKEWKPIQNVHKDGSISTRALKTYDVLRRVARYVSESVSLISVLKRESLTLMHNSDDESSDVDFSRQHTANDTLQEIEEEHNVSMVDKGKQAEATSGETANEMVKSTKKQLSDIDDDSDAEGEKTDARVCSTAVLAMQLVRILGDICDVFIAMTVVHDRATQYSFSHTSQWASATRSNNYPTDNSLPSKPSPGRSKSTSVDREAVLRGSSPSSTIGETPVNAITASQITTSPALWVSSTPEAEVVVSDDGGWDDPLDLDTLPDIQTQEQSSKNIPLGKSTPTTQTSILDERKSSIKSSPSFDFNDWRTGINNQELAESVLLSQTGAITFRDPTSATIFCNDCYYLAGKYTQLVLLLLRKIQNALEQAQICIPSNLYDQLLEDAKREHANAVNKGMLLMESGDTAWFAQLANLKEVITQNLQQIDSLHIMNELDRRTVDNTVAECVDVVVHASQCWSPVLSEPIYRNAVDALLSVLCFLLCEEVIRLIDIGSEESSQLHEVLKRVVRAAETIGGNPPDRFMRVLDILVSNLANIQKMLDRGQLHCFTKQELMQLVRALFSNSSYRDICLAQIDMAM